MYKAIVEFYDLADGNRKYRVGDKYPRPDLIVSDERIAELAGNGNKLGRAVIEKADDDKSDAKDDGELTREAVESMQYFKTKSLCKKNGIETDGKSNAELKTDLIEKLGL